MALMDTNTQPQDMESYLRPGYRILPFTTNITEMDTKLKPQRNQQPQLLNRPHQK